MKYLSICAALFISSIIPPAAVVEKTGMVPDRLDIQVSLSANSSVTGRYIAYQNFGGYAWVDGTVNPTWSPDKIIIAEYKGNPKPQVMWFRDGYFRTALNSTSVWGTACPMVLL